MNTYEESRVPYSIEAEQLVLGAVLQDPNLITSVAVSLKPDYFYMERHQKIFSAMTDFYNLARPIELVLLLEHLRDNGDFNSDEDAQYLYSLQQNASAIANIAHYTKIIYEAAMLREVIGACGDIDHMAKTGSELNAVLDEAERRFSNISDGKQNMQLHRVGTIVKGEMDRLAEMEKDDTGKFAPIKVGIGDLDAFIGGINNSDLIILAARPGVGKTSFALNVAYNIARNSDYDPQKEVVFFSLEMSKEQLARRVISSSARIDSSALRLGKLSESDWDNMYELWRRTLRHIDLWFDDTSTITVVEMKSKLRKVKNLGLVVIDYLQLMNSAKRIDNRVQEISEITRSLKLMAKELNVPIILLSQLSRGIEKRADGDTTPHLSDLRDSGSIEQDADIVIFLSRPDYYDKESPEKNTCYVHVEKNRHGSVGKVKIQWDGRYTSFASLAKERIPE